MATTTDTPIITGTINQQFFLTPLNGPENPSSYLDNFPSEVYTTSIDSHLVKFMYSLMGPSGLGWIQKNYLDARLLLEDHGIEGFSLDDFYGDPIRFGRILEETYARDLSGLISREEWNVIKAKDAKYRSRALNYITGVRAGNTPLGMAYVAKSGLGHEATIVENYRYLYDQHSDDTIGIEYKGSTLSTEEMIVIPRAEVPVDETQQIQFFTDEDELTGSFKLYFPNGDPTNPDDVTRSTASIIFVDGYVDRNTVQSALEALPAIGLGNIEVSGGPFPDAAMTIRFVHDLNYKDVQELQVAMDSTLKPLATATVVTTQDGVSRDNREQAIATRDQHYLLQALDYIKPVTTIVTFANGKGTSNVQTWNGYPSVSSEYHEVVRYVTGKPTIQWPSVDGTHWVEPGIEKKSLRAYNDLQYHYQGFHNVTRAVGYTDEAVADVLYPVNLWSDSFQKYRSEHVGNFTPLQRALFPHLNSEFPTYTPFSGSNGVALYPEPLVTTSSNTVEEGAPTQLVNGIYPADYLSLPGVSVTSDSPERFWASLQRETGSDYLEIDLGQVQAVNYLTFEISNKPALIEIAYDVLDDGETRNFVPVTHNPDFPVTEEILFNSVQQSPWRSVEYLFGNGQNNMIYTRYLRIKLTRVGGVESPFVAPDGSNIEYSFEVKNLRLGRNI